MKAIRHWKGEYPKFNTPEPLAELDTFAASLVESCTVAASRLT